MHLDWLTLSETAKGYVDMVADSPIGTALNILIYLMIAGVVSVVFFDVSAKHNTGSQT